VFDKPVKDTKTQAQEKEEHFLNVIGQQNMEIDVLKKALS
jgi:transposase